MRRNAFSTLASALATLGMMLPSTSFAAAPVPAVTDIALRPGGVLLGQVVDAQGVPKKATPITLQFAGREVVRTTTDENGVFAAQGLRGGEYQIQTTEGTSSCRLWAANTAPPSAQPAALVVSGNDLVRGQFGQMNSWKEWVKSHPYITAGTVAAAIAVPLVLADDDWDSGS